MAFPLKLELDMQGKVHLFRACIAQEAEDLVSAFFPQEVLELNSQVQELRLQDLSRIHSVPTPEPLATPGTVGDGPNQNLPPLQTQFSIEVPALLGSGGQRLRSNQHVMDLIDQVKPETELLKEKCNTVRMWVYLLIPKVEDGNHCRVSGYPERHCGPAVDCGEHSGLLSTRSQPLINNCVINLSDI